jgi:hypothetical protein
MPADVEKPSEEPLNPFEDVTSELDQGMTMHRLLTAFQSLFGLGMSAVSTEFRAFVRKVIEEDHPTFRCSAARMIFEGRIPGVPKPYGVILPGFKKRYVQYLYLMDLFETIVQRYLEEEVRGLSTSSRKEVRELKSVLGTVKVPKVEILLDALRKEDRRKGKKAKKTA